MVVQHNLRAMNSNRMLGITTKQQAKSTEKLSSGYKINRAADDAAGLAISEKMRKQIRGLTQASLNAQDGISCVQTAEGALTEVHDMLQRMNELSVKASNGTMSETDRQSVQDEIDQLITEIDRVSETTKFNETYLLKGEGKNTGDAVVNGMVGGISQDGNVVAAKGNIFSGTFDDDSTKALAAGTEDTATITYLDAEGNKKTKEVTFITGKDTKTTAENFAKAINEDKNLKEIFKATSDASGKISIESKLDGTQTDNTKNMVDKITFLSETNSAGATTTTRINSFGGTDAKTAATGESYSLQLGKGTPGTTAAVAWDLVDGESITINGKTYTYDKNKGAGSEANSFKSLEDLQKLLGDDFEVSLQFTATKTDTTYGAATTDILGVSKSTVSTDLKAAGLTKDLTAIAAADFNDTFNDGTATANQTIATYSDMKLELKITAKNSLEKPSDTLTLSLQVGADTSEENKISVDIESMSAKSLGISNVEVTGKDSSNADEAVNKIADAIAKVSAQRSALGATQNRLEHTINNLDNVVENTTAAESQIRDTDMATEMVRYSNNNILAQAGQAMLAQSNQANQGVLSLLQ